MNITSQQIKNFKLVSALSITINDSCDINDISHFLFYLFCLQVLKGKKKLLLLKDWTHGEDIANTVIECMEKDHILLDKIVSVLNNFREGKICDQSEKMFCF